MKETKKYKRVLLLGDIHLPCPDWEAIKQAAKFNKKFKAQLVITTGDLIDAKAWSRYSKSTDDLNAYDEWEATVKAAKKLAKYFPKLTIIMGNHEARIANKAVEANLPPQLVRGVHEALGIKNWTWHLSTNPLVIKTPSSSFAIIHGDEMAGTCKQKASRLGMNLVHGHTHQASLDYINTFDKQLWAMDVGCMADLQSKAMSYAAKNPLSCFVGFGYIEDGVPHLVPKK